MSGQGGGGGGGGRVMEWMGGVRKVDVVVGMVIVWW